MNVKKMSCEKVGKEVKITEKVPGYVFTSTKTTKIFFKEIF